MRFELTSPLQPCLSPIWAQGGHLQTILGFLIPSPNLAERGETLEVEVSGGDKVVTHHLPGQSNRVVYLFHGLGGESHGSYMQRTALLAQSLGHTVFMSNHRGCGEGRGLAKEPYHSGRAEDLSKVIELGRRMYPNHHHVAIGFSLSGNALLLLAAKQRAMITPDAAIAVNAPIFLERAALLLKRGLNRIYDFKFMQDMRREIQSRSAADLSIPWHATLHDFDDLYTAPAGGFKNREDYYRTCSALPYLRSIEIPTVILTAEDDPFVSVEDYRQAELSPSVHLHVEKTGGHMGYITRQKTPLGTHRWLDYALLTFLDSLDNHT
jgi:uncharacterized protein